MVEVGTFPVGISLEALAIEVEALKMAGSLEAIVAGVEAYQRCQEVTAVHPKVIWRVAFLEAAAVEVETFQILKTLWKAIFLEVMAVFHSLMFTEATAEGVRIIKKGVFLEAKATEVV